MADIRTTSTGREFFQIDNSVAALLLEAFPASFERVERQPAPPAKLVPTFHVMTLPYSDGVAVARKRGAETLYFDDYPYKLRAHFPHGPANEAEVEAHKQKLGLK
jgi:hypothetical protein